MSIEIPYSILFLREQLNSKLENYLPFFLNFLSIENLFHCCIYIKTGHSLENTGLEKKLALS